MKNILITVTIILSIYSLNAQDNFYGQHIELVKNQQKEVLKNLSIKKIIINSYQYISNTPQKTSKKILKLNKIGAVQ